MDYKEGRAQQMTPQLWQAKKIVDSTLHPGMRCALDASAYIIDTRQIRASRSSYPSACPASFSPTSSSQPACSPPASAYVPSFSVLCKIR